MPNKSNILFFNDLKTSLIDFQKNDLLVHLPDHAKWCFSIEKELISDENNIIVPLSEEWIKFHKRITDLFKETGSQTACITTQIIQWEYKNELIKSPFTLIPVSLEIDKNAQKINLYLATDDAFINPFIVKQFEELFGLNIHLLSEIEIQEKIKVNPRIKSLESCSIIGQFHYHRYLFLKEIEEIENTQPSSLLQQLIGGESITNSSTIYELSQKNLLFSDPIQQKALNHAGKESFVLQGPPGTGKSQVIINLLGKALMTSGNFACVSEKKSALDVIQKKLSQAQLGHFSVYLDDQIHLKEVYSQFKNAWQYLEATSIKPNHAISSLSFAKNKLQLLIDRIQTHDLSSGVSFWELKKRHESLHLDLVPDTTHSISIADWDFLKSRIDELKALPFEIWAYFSMDFWKEKKWDSVTNWIEQWEKYKEIFSLNTVSEIKQLNEWCVIHQIEQSENFENFKRIVFFKSNWQKFSRSKKKYFQLQLELDAIKEKVKSWKSIPTPLQIKDWEAIQNKTFGKKKTERILNQEISEGISLETVQQIATAYFQIQEAILHCKKEFTEWAIFHPEQDFATIDWLKSNYHSITDTSWKTYEQLSENQKQSILVNYKSILNFSRNLPITNKHSHEHIQRFITTFQANLPLIKKIADNVATLPSNVYYWMQRKTSFQQVEEQIVCNEWHQFQQLFPEMASLDLTTIKSQLEAIISQDKEEQALFREEIITYRKKRFDQYHQLLLHSPRKLSEEEKKFRQKLKKGKAILVKEMNKMKQHLPLRELWQSDAKHWLQVLTPIWLMTPTQLSKHFPLQENLFQLAMIDEASQLPISHSIGTLQRSSQVIIAGDSQQMAPSNFFQSEKETSILSHAQFHLPNYRLTYHYRSQHPDLIRFSNQYFYHNELEVFPYNHIDTQPIQRLFVSDGRFINRQNIAEAKIVVEQIQKALNENNSMGIVAFSETQVQAIWDQMDGVTRERLSMRLEENTAFFKSLDKVQGDECDTLIISFGYAKNEMGEFHLHLGPILQKGEDKRLNVLFSRAKKKILFITSIEAKDIPISDNPTIELLRRFYLFIESQSTLPILPPPSLKKWLDTIQNADELLTKYRVYRERGWEF